MLELYPYDSGFKGKFKRQKIKISRIIGNSFEIHHIGSTAVLGLGGKGIIDIMIALDNWRQAATIVKKLKSIGFSHVHPKENGRIFLSQHAQTKFGDFHVHLVIRGGKQYNNLLAFKNYMITNKAAAKKYFQFKNKLVNIAGNRQNYTAVKGKYINQILKEIYIHQLIFATTNDGKIDEVSALLRNMPIKIISSKEAGFTEDVKETGSTLKANALKKAQYVAKKTGSWTIAEDTGLFIKSLNNRPGIFASRWSDGKDLVEFTLDKMKKIPTRKRQAYFETMIALVSPSQKVWFFGGKISGTISKRPAGRPRAGRPYDTIFVPNHYKKTFAQMTLSQKNNISHQTLAFAKLKKFLIAQLLN